MILKRLDHINIKAPGSILEKVKAFYMDLLDLTEGFRPAFPGRGAWLYCQDHPVIHLSQAETVEAAPGAAPCLDHVAFRCDDYPEIQRRLNRMKVETQVFRVPELEMTQIFLKDPAGIRIELNFVDGAGTKPEDKSGGTARKKTEGSSTDQAGKNRPGN